MAGPESPEDPPRRLEFVQPAKRAGRRGRAGGGPAALERLGERLGALCAIARGRLEQNLAPMLNGGVMPHDPDASRSSEAEVWTPAVARAGELVDAGPSGKLPRAAAGRGGAGGADRRRRSRGPH